jgi:putative membrane-bound dehydrogenase-like protein
VTFAIATVILMIWPSTIAHSNPDVEKEFSMRCVLSFGSAGLLIAALAVWAVAQDKPKSDVPPGVIPKAVDGKPLNLDFESGDLRDWVATGDAFSQQPVKGDSVYARRQDMKSEHAGNFWVGSYERMGDAPQGTLSSSPFVVTHRFAAFLIGGGSTDATRVELVRKDTGRVFYKTSADDRENMHRVVVDLKDVMEKEIFIRLVDASSAGWGHINFDDFRFYETKPNFPGSGPRNPADLFEFAGLSPDDAAKAMTLPEGFTVTAFAGEPDIKQPIAMTIDDRGRLWVAEAYSYPVKLPADKAHDRILIFEDTDGDGKFDKRTVFTDTLNLVSGLEVGFGGVWVGAAPELLFIPDANGDDKPDGPPQVLLDGWAFQDTHETLNSFIWGPDGWLYGCHGVFTHSNVGKPGAPDRERTKINAGIWRYHPTKHEFEVFAWGTSNPWGVDFNEHGHAFLTCCVIPHLFHVVQGGRFQRQAGEHFQPHTYADIPTIARHRHWTGNQWNEADRARSDASGGGHAHAGAMIYLGGSWPETYRGQLFMNNIHGARLNQDVLTPAGSGYVGDGAPDFCKANDLWSQILYLRYGPDGQVYMIDWYDRNQCHHGEVNGHDRSNGRIFKISYGKSKPAPVDLKKKTDLELVELQLDKNEWYGRQARRIMQERSAAKKFSPRARAALERLEFRHDGVPGRLRGLWGLHLTGGLSEEQVLQALHDDSPIVRGWAIQLACENGQPTEKVLDALMSLSRGDDSPVVRLYIASALQRIEPEKRWDILVGLLSQAADNDDHNLPLMDWYAAEPLADVDAARALALAAEGNMPLVFEFMVRRVGSIGTPESLDLVVGALGTAKEPQTQLLILRGIRAALTGRRQVATPKGWAALAKTLEASKLVEIRTMAFSLSVKFGDPAAIAEMREQLANLKTPVNQRKEYLASLLAAKDKDLVGVLRALFAEPALRGEAIRGLAAYDDPKTPELLLAVYPRLSAAEKRDALATLASRAAYAKSLLASVESKKVPVTDLTADLVRQMRNLKNEEIDAQIVAVWGVVRDTPEEKAKLIAHYRQVVLSQPARPDDLPLGRAVFVKTCQQCHNLFGVGAKIGPELTGSNRADLNYLLSNVLDPSAVMAREYIPTVIVTTGGRVITGLVREETKNALTVVTANETVVVPRDEVEEQKLGDKSMMPDDLLKPLSDSEVRALVAYLASPRQVAVLATPDNLPTFFNGKDLAGWEGNPELWRVENGEIVGTSKGLARNEFLVNHLLLGDFRLSLSVKLVPNAGNSGIQFRSEALPAGEVKGYQADVGVGWWGKLYEEHGRELLWKESGEKHVRIDDWNRYEIIAVGSRLKTFINGKPCVDLDDPAGAKNGIIALQLHAGGPFEVRFKDFELELNPKVETTQ